MKIRSSVLIFCIITILVIIFVIWFGKRQNQFPTQSIGKPVIAQTNVSAGITQMMANQTVPIITNGAIVSTNRHRVPPPRQDRVEILKTLLQANDADIVFYGRLEDQFGNSVAGANVNFSIGHEDLSGAGEKRGQTTSDSNGFFTISGYKGADLGIMPAKAGYTLATTSTYFKYSHLNVQYFVPDANNPTVIKMWKLQGAGHLISFNIQTYIPVDNIPVALDLQTGQQVKSGGDIVVRIQSSTKPSVREEYDWQVAIQMAAGGIIESNGLGLQKMFEAPESGYEPEFDLSFQKGTQQWTSRLIDGFYFTSRSGQSYGKMAISIITDRIRNGSVPVTLNGYLNPAGSRNLEIDPKLVTEAHP